MNRSKKIRGKRETLLASVTFVVVVVVVVVQQSSLERSRRLACASNEWAAKDSSIIGWKSTVICSATMMVIVSKF